MKVEYIKKQVKRGKPIQHYFPNFSFFGYNYEISKKLLIPRFETEFLVEKTLKIIKRNFKNPKIIDLGCGTGVIGLTLKQQLKSAEIKLIDIDANAIYCTRKNARKFKLDVEIKKQNMLEGEQRKYDVIISNPPYIPENTKIEKVVYKNEPHHALFAKDNGVYYYKKILSSAKKNLNTKNLIAFEIGENQGSKIKEIALKYYPDANIIVEKDYNDIDRYVFILNGIN